MAFVEIKKFGSVPINLKKDYSNMGISGTYCNPNGWQLVRSTKFILHWIFTCCESFVISSTGTDLQSCGPWIYFNIHTLYVVAVTEDGKVGGQLSKDFFKEEYILNNKIGKTRFDLPFWTNVNTKFHFALNNSF